MGVIIGADKVWIHDFTLLSALEATQKARSWVPFQDFFDRHLLSWSVMKMMHPLECPLSILSGFSSHYDDIYRPVHMIPLQSSILFISEISLVDPELIWKIDFEANSSGFKSI